ncbi:MAG: ABC transporter ATP-binding protein [Flavobacteriaceae bacterium]|nr:ABC transporter ATP-binding protein [Flavobacteriaceae bacterium]
MITLENISKEYINNGNYLSVLKNISFSISQGQFISLVGMSGSGKTTLLKIISGLDKDHAGIIKINNDSLEEYLKQHTIALVPQQYSNFNWLNVFENVHEGNKNASEEEVSQILEYVGLSKFKNAHLKDLSGGMKQRVAVARTLLQDTELIILDEPFGALDVKTRYSLGNLLKKIALEKNKTVILVTHDIADASRLSDRILILGDGSIQEDILVSKNKTHEVEENIFSYFMKK